MPGWHVAWQQATASTNADLQHYLRSGNPGPALLGAHAQTSGRGRAGRPWQTRAGDALLFSCGWRTLIEPARLPPLSLVAGVAACEALSRLLGQGRDGALALKWPNDLYWHGAKLAGILVETTALPAGQRSRGASLGLILGMGINLRGADALSDDLGREVADWEQTGGAADASRLAAEVAHAWHAALDLYAAGGFDPFLTRFARWDALYGQAVRVLDDGQLRLEGIARGVDATGRLQVDTRQGRTAIMVGDVSVRPAQAAAHP
ncbi:Bifunctional ligase/repressor BirA [Pigmentiphaga humi]|uniref:biotin--[biotin carboxyl-carrier protein] ligase n=1 Tax=Pigmentiphaga humi TaxID=2478468 RepID=A0A3P4AYV2_9BURK|nr:Bifunctional ligase/repressor BirA [Pigmentiphaga humi]